VLDPSHPHHELPGPALVEQTGAIRVALLEHQELVRDAYVARLGVEPAVAIVGLHSSACALLATGDADGADVIVCSYALADHSLDGIGMIRRLHERCPAQRILVLTPAASPGLISMAMGAGAHGVVSSGRPWEEIVAAIRDVAAGQAPILRDRVPLTLSTRRLAGPAEFLLILDHPWLTEQEREVLRCCLAGLSVSQTAAKLQRSAHTISTQKRSAYNKLNIHNDFQLFALIRSV